MANDAHNQKKFEFDAYQKLISYSDWNDQSLSNISPGSPLTVIHLAGLAHQMDGATEADMHAANTAFAIRVARQALSAGAKTFVLVSTAKVMGDRTAKPVVERNQPQPNDAYSRTKLAAEVALQGLFRNSSCKLVIVRPPLVYGPQAKANFESLMRWCATSVWLPFGAVIKPRSMVYIDNLCDALLWCSFNPAARPDIYFVKDAEDLSIRQWITQTRQALGRPTRLLWVPISLLKISAILLKKSVAIDKLVSSFQINDQQIRADGWAAPTTVREAISLTCAAWIHK